MRVFGRSWFVGDHGYFPRSVRRLTPRTDSRLDMVPVRVSIPLSFLCNGRGTRGGYIERNHIMADRDVISALTDSGLLRPDIALREIVKVTERLSSLAPEANAASDFVYQHFVWRPRDVEVSREAFAVIRTARS